ncbi:MAG: hypothetical protein IAE82_21430 [Opitutaceae bacterium]|nr:hypothetical protein [Opitutaceae bacterium]
MSPRLLPILSLVFALAGCSPRHERGVAEGAGHDHHAHGAEAVAAEYKAGHGVRLGATAAAFVGLRLGDVETRDLPSASAATAVPRDAVLHTVRGTFVFVDNGGWLLRTPVSVGVSEDGWVEVRDGLYEGDRVAVAGVDALWLAEISAVNGGVGCADGH